MAIFGASATLPMETTRLFIARAVNAKERQLIEDVCQSELASPAWRILAPRSWHVTALFLGDQPTDRVPKIMEAIAEQSQRWQAFTLYDGILSTMPSTEPSMLWIRFRPSDELQSLHAELAQRTDTPPSPHSPFLPHITLARTNRSAHAIDGPLVMPSMNFDELTLFRSDPAPRGRVHSPLASWTLG